MFALGGCGGARWHEAVCAAVVESAAAEVGAPGFFVEEIEEVVFLGWSDEV